MGQKSKRKWIARQAGNQPAQQQQSVSISYSGPLPPASQLEHYNRIFDGCAERIVAMAEKQSDHRQDLEKTKLRSDITSERLGTILGFLIVMSAIIGGVYLIRIDKNAYGIAAIIGSLATLAGVFVYGRHAQRKERDKKVIPPPQNQQSD